MTNRILPGIPDYEYHASPGVTFHRLMDFVNHGPAYYEARHILQTIQPPPQTDWGQLGTAYHIWTLEGEGEFTKRVVRMPETYFTEPPVDAPWNNRKKFCQEWAKANPGKPTPATFPDGDPVEEKAWNMGANFCKEWVAKQEGKIVLSSADYAAACAIGRNARSNTHAARLLACGWPELTIEADEPGLPVPVKCRIDWLASTSTKMEDAWAVVDVKGTDALDQFDRDAFKYKYPRQMAWYRMMVFHAIGKLLPCFMPAVEKSCMHRCRAYGVDLTLLDEADEQNQRDLDRLKACYAKNEWPLDHDDAMRVLTPRAAPVDGQEVAPW